MMKDRYGRKIDYMRISITDRCNLRCRYCMPDGVLWVPMEDLLTYEEILNVCREAVALGICKFKITGGEPLVRKGCEWLVREIRKIPDAKQVTMTTNGVLLKEHLKDLVSAGLDGVNISLDTVKPELYEKITGFPKLGQVLQSIDAAADSGIKVKLNVVLQKGVNDSEWQELLTFAEKRSIDVRFIELMPIGYGRECDMVSNMELLQWIRKKYADLAVDEQIHGNGPAVYYRIPGFHGSVGLISAIHGKFCDSCNRIRMTSTGEIKPCLCYENSLSVREAVRAGKNEEVRKILEQAILGKPKMHCFEHLEDITEQKKMTQIGG